MANGLDMDSTGFGVRQGAIWRNDGPDSFGWFYCIGSAATRGPYPTKAAARAAANGKARR